MNPSTAASDQSSTGWTQFWFCTTDRQGALRSVRIGMAVMAFWYFASHWADIGMWLGGDGILASEALARFLSDAELGDLVRWRLSPLYWIDSPAVLRGYLIVGMALAVATAVVRQSRAVQVALWLMVVWLANRTLMLAGLEELVLAFGLGYLALAPADDAPHWSGSLALRLLQLHVSFLIAVTGLTMLSSLIWWDGSGALAVVAPVENRYIDWVDGLSTPWVHELLTHAIVSVAILAPLLLWCANTRRAACVVATLWCVALGLLSSQLLYFAALAVLLQVFWRHNSLPHRSTSTLAASGERR
jgi:hypothetical protein